ncbi:unnamed protein product, partial [Fusarium fujikuroi]
MAAPDYLARKTLATKNCQISTQDCRLTDHKASPSLAYTNPHAETNTDGRRDRVLPWPQISSFRIRTATDSIVPHGGSKLPDSDVTGSMSLCTNPSREEQLHLPPISPQS